MHAINEERKAEAARWESSGWQELSSVEEEGEEPGDDWSNHVDWSRHDDFDQEEEEEGWDQRSIPDGRPEAWWSTSSHGEASGGWKRDRGWSSR